jgi:hypothetical protein
VLEDGTHLAVVFNHDKGNEIKPEQKGCVRGDSILGGWIFQPSPSKPGHTLAAFQLELDLKGSIPGWVVKKANTGQGYQIQKMRDSVKKYLASKEAKGW